MTTASLVKPVRSELLAALFPPWVVAREMRGDADATSLGEQEALACASFQPKRLAEFAAGRLCARSALAVLGHPDFALVPNADRSPRWPHGIAGSITHTPGFCGAVAGRRSDVAALGVDAEIVARVAAEVWPQVFTPAEFARLERLDSVEQERFAALIFSAKESFYKGQFALTRSWLDFHDVSVELEPEEPNAGRFVARAASARAAQVLRGLSARGRYRFEDALVVTGVAFDAGAASLPAPRCGE